MNKKRAFLILLTIGLFFTNSMQANAAITGYGRFVSHEEVGIGYNLNASQDGAKEKDIDLETNRNYTSSYVAGKWQIYYHSNLKFDIAGGGTVDAYCLDPGLTLSSAGTYMTCAFEDDPELFYIITANKNVYDYKTRSFAIRIWSTNSKWVNHTSNSSTLKDVMEKYSYAIFNENGAGSDNYMKAYTNRDKNIKGDTLLSNASKLAKEAHALENDSQVYDKYSLEPPAEMDYKKGSIITKKDDKGNEYGEVTYSLKSTGEIKKENLTVIVDCTNCEIINSGVTYKPNKNEKLNEKAFYWNNIKDSKGNVIGTGSITVKYLISDSNYKITISYPTSGIYICRANNDSTQKLAIKVDDKYTLVINDKSTSTPGPGPDPETCEMTPKIEGTIENCCTRKTSSSMREDDLDDLFCYNKDIGALYTARKGKNGGLGAELYKLSSEDTGLDGNYCNMYCTERVDIEIPGSITATSGRYFKLSTLTRNGKEYTSPYVEGYKRCRIVVNYEAWHKAYYEAVQNEVNQYNSYQEWEAKRLLYESNGKNVNVTKEGNQTAATRYVCTASAKIKYKDDEEKTCGEGDTPDENGKCYEEKEKETTAYAETKYVDVNYTYTKYTFKNTSMTYYKVRSDGKKVEHFNSINIQSNGSGTHTQKLPVVAWYVNTPDKPSEWQGKSVTVSAEGEKATTTYNCTIEKSFLEAAGLEQQNVEATYNEAASKASQFNNNFKSAVNAAESLEKKLNDCNHYFEKSEYTNSEFIKNNLYKFNPTVEFSYSQNYVKNNGKLANTVQNVPFESASCTYTLDKHDVDDEGDGLTGLTLASGDRPLAVKMRSGTSTKFSGNGKQISSEVINTFKNVNLSYVNSNSGYSNYTKKDNYAEKIVSHDARYKVECYWEEKPNYHATLVPTGESVKTDSYSYVIDKKVNGVMHKRTYYVYLSTLSGSYDTFWSMSGIGSRKGQFDSYIRNNKKNCSGDDLTDTQSFACKFEVNNKVKTHGECNIPGDPCDELDLFSFKIADPANLFVSNTSDKDLDYGYNWLKTSEGQAAMQKIEALGATSSTYSPDTLTYSFIFTPSDIKHIQRYNDEQKKNGGYSNFTLNCSCPSQGTNEDDVTDSATTEGCTKCVSPFLTNLAEGKITYNNKTYSITGGWNNTRKNISEVRKGNNW